MPLDYKNISVLLYGGQDNKTEDQLLPQPKLVDANDVRVDVDGSMVKRLPYTEEHVQNIHNLSTSTRDIPDVWYVTPGKSQIAHTTNKVYGLDSPQDSGSRFIYEPTNISLGAASPGYGNINTGFRKVNDDWVVAAVHTEGSAPNLRLYVSAVKNGVNVISRVQLTSYAGTGGFQVAVHDMNTVVVYYAGSPNGIFRTEVPLNTTAKQVSGGLPWYAYAGVLSVLSVTEHANISTEVVAFRESGAATQYKLYTVLDGAFVRTIFPGPTLPAAGGTIYYGKYDVGTGLGLSANGSVVYCAFTNTGANTTLTIDRYDNIDTGTPVRNFTAAHQLDLLTTDTLSGVGPGLAWGNSLYTGGLLLFTTPSAMSSTGLSHTFEYDVYANTLTLLKTQESVPPSGSGWSLGASPATVAGARTYDDGTYMYADYIGRSVGFSEDSISVYSNAGYQVGSLGHLTVSNKNSANICNTWYVFDDGRSAFVYLEGVQALARTDGLLESAQLGTFSSSRLVVALFSDTPVKVPIVELHTGGMLVGGMSPHYYNSGSLFPLGPKFDTSIDVALNAAPAGSSWSATGAQNVVVETLWEWTLPDGTSYRMMSSPVSLLVPTGNGVDITYPLPIEVKELETCSVVVQCRLLVEGEYFYTAYTDLSGASVYAETKPVLNASLPAVKYLADGELDVVHWPTTFHMIVFNNQVWVVDSERRSTLLRTKPITQGTIPELTSELFETIPYDVTALAVMDSKLIVFGESQAGFFSGNGEDFAGNGSGYKFNQLPDAPGPLGQASVVMTPTGVMYERDGEFHMLLRNMSLQVDLGPRLLVSDAVSDAYYDYDTHEAVFLAGGHVYVYNTDAGVWSNLTTPRGFATSSTTEQGDKLFASVSTSYPNLQLVTHKQETLPNTNSNRADSVYSEQPDDFFKDTTTGISNGAYGTRITTGWIAFNNIIGYGALRSLSIVGKYYSRFGGDVSNPSGLNVYISYNYDTTVQDTFTFQGTDLVARNVGEALQLKVRPSRRKCEAIRVTIEEAPAVNGGAPGFSVTSLNLEVGLKDSSFKQIPIGDKK